MNRPTAPLTHYSLAHQIAAIGLAWLMAAGGLPTSALSSRPAASSGAHISSAFSATLPVAAALPEEPAPTPAFPQDAEADKKAREEAEKWGEITVGQPKIWQYERVNSLLDGLLRDVEGVSLNDLVSLDPNATNGAAVKFVQSMLEIGAKYDQAAAVTNGITQQNYAATQGVASTQIQANSAYLQQLYRQRANLTDQLLAAMDQNTVLQGQLATTDPTTAAYKSLTTKQQAAASEVTSLQSNVSSINSQITAASSATIPAAPNLAATAAANAPENANTFSDFLTKLPPDLTKNLVSQLQSPSYPATKRLDNFITLLYERLAREISVLQDDVMRDPDNVPFLVQFDVGLYPSGQAKNHVGVVEFTMNCGGCKVYSIYPGQSSYNLANYEGASKRTSLWGAFQSLFGFGISGDYRRQTDTLHGDLVQSVYMSGFQEGASSKDRTNTDVQQRFGWYYGEAPFETKVTPGIRTTFAIVSIPRKLIADCTKPAACQDPDGSKRLPIVQKDAANKEVALNMEAHADWVRRDNPFYQQPHSWLYSLSVGRTSKFAVPRKLSVALPGTDNLASVPEIALQERNRLHVLGIEYNPVYFSDSNEPGAPNARTSGLGATPPADASKAGGNAPAGVPPAPPTPGVGSPPQADAFTGCQQNQCAALLVKLAEPIDPDLVVSVRGVPLRRVRDWRGRATSILPPAQSMSDVAPAPPGATAQPQRSENPSSRSLLEVDQLAPDSWIEVDSHRLLLNVSRSLAGEREFPTIQVVDPGKRALFIPLDLDQGFSEVIMNGFHLPIWDTPRLKAYIDNRFSVVVDSLADSADLPKLHPAGPYPYATFLPLFLPKRPPRKVYAFLGETGTQLLIFLSNSFEAGAGNQEKSPWLPSTAQVILEDSDLDLAWSLSCYPQGPGLICNVPQREIRDAYTIVNKECMQTGDKDTRCPSILNNWNDFPSISTLQVWVEQYDLEGKDFFYTPDPARLGVFPVQAGGSPGSQSAGPDVGFSPWQFESADQDFVTLVGCNYPMFENNTISLSILGRHIPQGPNVPPLDTFPVANPDLRCRSFKIPTVALTHEEVVIRYKLNGKTPGDTPESLSAGQFRPYFGMPLVSPHFKPGNTLAIDRWRVDIPAGRVDCRDMLNILDAETTTKMNARWRIGAVLLDLRKIGDSATESCQTKLAEEAKEAKVTDIPEWSLASKNGQIMLEFDVKKNDLGDLPLKKQMQILRGANLTWVATIADLRSLLLPTKLAVVNMGKNQFALEGEGAEAIDAVTIQGSGAAIGPIPAASAAKLALITLPEASKAPSDSSAPTKPVKTNAQSGAIKQTASHVLSPGTYTVVPLIALQKKDEKGNPQYLPLEVEAGNLQDKPLTYTVPEQTKDTGKGDTTTAN